MKNKNEEYFCFPSCGKTGAAMRFLRMRGVFFKNVRHFKDIFREFEAFFKDILKISILFEDIFREIEAFFN
jgi:hypothetical protein